MNVMQQPGPGLPYGTEPGAPHSNGKIPKVPGVPRNENPARAIVYLGGVTIYCTIFSITTHIRLVGFYATKYF